MYDILLLSLLEMVFYLVLIDLRSIGTFLRLTVGHQFYSIEEKPIKIALKCAFGKVKSMLVKILIFPSLIR